METYNGMYLGIVIQNDDPDKRGRVKVWVPHINSSIYNKWAELKKDRAFKFPGKNIDSDLSLIINDLKDSLSWAEYCSPIMGESSSGSFNAFADTATTSDATSAGFLSGSNFSKTLPQYNLNSEKMGEKPGFVFEKYGSRVTDAFTDTNANKTNTVNPAGNQYRPATYSNAAKGIFAIPNVGAHVWVIFRDGIPLYPVYMGTVYSMSDYKSIFKSEDEKYQDYPGMFENTSKTLRDFQDDASRIHRNKMVINQTGAAIEIINTTDRERFKVTHFAGGFLEFNNQYNSLFSPKNLQLLTLRDKFETVRGHNNLFVDRDFDEVIQGDRYLKIGNLNKTALDEWITAYRAIADILKLPETDATKDTLATVVAAQTQALVTAESKLGMGGNFIETVTKHKLLNVGLVFNIFDSTRYNGNLKAVPRFRNVNDSATTLVTAGLSAIEYTHVDDMPGGNYTQAIGNRWSVMVGAGGIDVKSTGPLNLGGTIMAIAGKQMNIASSDDTNIDGGTGLTVIANLVNIRSRLRDQVLVDDNLGISRNVVIGGGSYTEGEVYVQHVTAPVEFQVTESTLITDAGYNIKGVILKNGGGNINSGDTVYLNMAIDAVAPAALTINQPHTHYFKNLPLTLVTNNAAVRTLAIATVNASLTAAPAHATATHYNSAGGNLNSNPNGPILGIPG